MLILLEYLTALNTRNTLNVLNNRNILSSLRLLFKIVTEGRMDNRSRIAIPENGYRKKESAPFSS